MIYVLGSLALLTKQFSRFDWSTGFGSDTRAVAVVLWIRAHASRKIVLLLLGQFGTTVQATLLGNHRLFQKWF